ncbi:methionyl-tRNA formyltransferase [Desulfovibrio sulfodismutans]|uniref:Methionyl-tRNA formyltransferase n=1 Tax=Desulfolutivibrio sulfodismutans TaxID=63561 RepID=A0A7K3NRH2_9BACT|nr:methionyl-tRNA formyltransferase [Desulfolutivibrio sulfodismutans]NDY58751.1 methionyl-tRNA formyltransferase [Desulfolutivibrio sulfodismutans]QLA13144.1 methionyl-tRNA formyltransferase [Desulfolutivibrio sulfodismutans DSM 3696]
MGTPDFAAAVLRGVLDAGACQVVAVYTQPDRPCGRGQACRPGPVKTLALEMGLPVLQPADFKSPDEVARLAAFEPDLLLVAAYGMLLPQAVLDVPKIMPINVHASLLPGYRGAAPVQRAILSGDTVTGATIMRMVKALDAGPILAQRALTIGFDDDAGTILSQMAAMGGTLLAETLTRMAAGPILEIPQDESRATYAAKIGKAEAEIRFDRPVMDVHNRIRAFSPKPGAFFHVRLRPGAPPLRVIAAPGRPESAPGGTPPEGAAPGTVLGLAEGNLRVACADGVYLIPRLRPAGKKEMTAEAFACGYLGKCPEGASPVCGPGDLDTTAAT